MATASGEKRNGAVVSFITTGTDSLQDENVNSDSQQVEASLETPPKAPPVPPVARPPSSVSPSKERVPSSTSDTSKKDSHPNSLQPDGTEISPTLTDLAKNTVKKEFNLSDLQQLKVMDVNGVIVVKEAIPLCQLRVGDILSLRNARGLEMNAEQLREHIRTSTVLTLARGVVCTVKEEGSELTINIKGSHTVRLNTVDLIRRAFTSPCYLHYAEVPELSNLTITEINDIPVPIGSQSNQIAESMKEALETSGGKLTLHLVPQSLLDALAEEDEDTHEEQAHNIVDK